MKLYVLAKSRADLIRRLKSGERINGTNYSMFGGGGIYALDANLENGTLIAIYEKMSGGNPISKSYGTWGEKGLKFYGEPEPVEPDVQDENENPRLSEQEYQIGYQMAMSGLDPFEYADRYGY